MYFSSSGESAIYTLSAPYSNNSSASPSTSDPQRTAHSSHPTSSASFLPSPRSSITTGMIFFSLCSANTQTPLYALKSFISLSSSVFSIALNGHFSTQTPHPVQDDPITANFPSIVIALKGQFFTQIEQPLHFSFITLTAMFHPSFLLIYNVFLLIYL